MSCTPPSSSSNLQDFTTCPSQYSHTHVHLHTSRDPTPTLHQLVSRTVYEANASLNPDKPILGVTRKCSTIPIHTQYMASFDRLRFRDQHVMDCEALDASLVYIIYRTIYPYQRDRVRLSSSNRSMQANAYATSISTHEWGEGGVCNSPICRLWCHASESMNRPTTIPTVRVACLQKLPRRHQGSPVGLDLRRSADIYARAPVA